MPSSLLQVVNSVFQTSYNKLGTSSANTTCWQLVNRFVTTCLQTCNNLCVFTCAQCTIVNITRLVTMLFQQFANMQDVFAQLIPSRWQIVNGFLTTCYKVVELNRFVRSFSNNLLSSCNSTICQQVVSDNHVATWWNNSIVTTCWQACYKPVANTSCWQVVRFLRV
jgi:hypothetical protein